MDGKATLWIIAGIVVIGLVATYMVASGSFSTVTGIDIGNDESGQYSYAGKNVELALQSTNLYTAAAVDPTFYVYEQEPADWGNGRVDVVDGYISSVSSTSGAATMTEIPGTYFVRAVLSGYYDKFVEVTVPASGDVPLSQYNDGGEDIVKVQLVDVETLSVSNLDMGITTNETSDKTYRVTESFSVDDNEGLELVEIKFQEDATYAFATDTDGDGIYDEGINKIVFTFNNQKYTLFDATASIDEFGGDDLATITLAQPILYPENGFISVLFEVTCDATLDTTGDADEKCGNGEDFIDSVILVDAKGNTATFDLLG